MSEPDAMFNLHFPTTCHTSLRLRRQSSRIQIRLTVLENELTDTITEHQSLDGKCMSARMVLDHMRAEEQGVLQRCARKWEQCGYRVCGPEVSVHTGS